jgi:hypothetical protein
MTYLGRHEPENGGTRPAGSDVATANINPSIPAESVTQSIPPEGQRG